MQIFLQINQTFKSKMAFQNRDCHSVTGKVKGAKSEAEINSRPPSPSQSTNQQPDLRQTSVYTLTLDEFLDKAFKDDMLLAEKNETQDCHSVTGKAKGAKSEDEINSRLPSPSQSTNQQPHWRHALDDFMGEFFYSTLLAEENETQGIPPTPLMSSPTPFPMQEISSAISQADGIILNDQPSLPRQGYLNIPEPPYWKTVEEVSSELQNDDDHIHELLQSTNAAEKQPIPGELTLKDFLDWAWPPIKREPQSYDYMLPPPQQQQQQQQQPLELNQNYVHLNSGPNSPLIPGMATGGCVNIVAETPPGNGNGGGYMVSPGSSDRMCKNKVDGGKSKRGRKMVDRRPKIMLKNRESSARNRERKQACASEFEAELMFLEGENKRLKQYLAELESEKKNCRCSMMRKRHRGQNANMGSKSQKFDEEEETRANANMGTKSHKVKKETKSDKEI